MSDEKRFCPWYPLVDAASHAPPCAGVFQIKIPQGLITYPRGKSAMIHYGLAGDLQRHIPAWAAERRAGQDTDAGSWMCRHLAGDAAAMESEYHALVSRFATRFGTPPAIPRTRAHEESEP